MNRSSYNVTIYKIATRSSTEYKVVADNIGEAPTAWATFSTAHDAETFKRWLLDGIVNQYNNAWWLN